MGRWVAAWVVSAVAVVLVGGAPGVAVPRASPFAGLFDRWVTSAHVTVLPGPGWQEASGSPESSTSPARWRVRGEASMVCIVSSALAEPIVFTAGDDGDGDALSRVVVLWDGREVEEGCVAATDGELAVTIPPSLATPGTHELRYVAALAGDEPTFSSIGFRSGAMSLSFAVGERFRYLYVASLVSRGVGGANSPDTLGGFLIDGPGRVAIEMPAGGTFSTTLENGSFAPATFRVTTANGATAVRLAAMERREVSFAMSGTAGRVTLEVDGAGDGMFLWGAPLWSPPRVDARPPILLLTLDTTRKDVLGMYGGDRSLTPNLSRFAETATVYDHAYSTSPWTLPAHASIFTGLYPAHHGAGVASSDLGSGNRTLAEILRDAGYETAGLPGGLLCKYESGLGQGFLHYRQPVGFETPDAELTSAAIARLSRESTAPPFLFVNYFGPHYPYIARQPSFMHRTGAAERIAAMESSSPFRRAMEGDGAIWRRIVSGTIPTTESDAAAARAAYLANLSETDAEVGRLFAALRETDLFDRALIVVVADHGELLGERGFFTHGCRLDDELVSVPLMIKWPGQTVGQREKELVTIADLFPTILGAAGIAPPASDGLDLAPAGAASLAARRSIVMEEHERPSHPLFPNMKIDEDVFRLQGRDRMLMISNRVKVCAALLDSEWRTIDCNAAEASDMPRIPEMVRESMAAVRRGHPTMDEEQIRNLRSLGYLR